MKRNRTGPPRLMPDEPAQSENQQDIINYLETIAVQYAARQSPPPEQVPLRPAGQQALPPQQPSLGALPVALGCQPPAPAPLATPPGVGPDFKQKEYEELCKAALSYTAQVKYIFSTQPQVYNDFLDILNGLQTRTISTMDAVIRVSNLFKEHPDLIEGFGGIFLPPLY